MQVNFTAFVPGSVLLSITSALDNYTILLNVVAHCHLEPVGFLMYASVATAVPLQRHVLTDVSAYMSVHVHAYFKPPHRL